MMRSKTAILLAAAALPVLLTGCCTLEGSVAGNVEPYLARDSEMAPWRSGIRLREILADSAKASADELDGKLGFRRLPARRIAIPVIMSPMIRTLDGMCHCSKVDELENRMNQAAERAMHSAMPGIRRIINETHFDEPRAVVHGSSDAASSIMRRQHEQTMWQHMRDVVGNEMVRNDTVELHESLRGLYNDLPFHQAPEYSLEDHVTNHAMTGFWTVLGEQEARIRRKPGKKYESLFATAEDGGWRGGSGTKRRVYHGAGISEPENSHWLGKWAFRQTGDVHCPIH
ncbi:MAG: hypothetical protein ACI8W8_005104 [Rhodothermales bacterium]|jgi:hypothetical protein